MVSGNWLNKKVLMINETIQSASIGNMGNGTLDERSPDRKSDDDSIFNIELSSIM